MPTITAILTVYKRPQNLHRQLNALSEQTMKIDNIIVWDQMGGACDGELKPYKNIEFIRSSKNRGVRARFYMAFNVTTDFVFILDDDIIPGNKWVENCLECYNEKAGLYGSRGSIFGSMESRYTDRIVLDEANRQSEITEVDMSGHSWFFHRDMLPKMFSEMPSKDYPYCGEELWVSYMLGKNGIKTYVPPMSDDIETHGNKEPRLGLDSVAGYNIHKQVYQEFYLKTIEHGFIPLQFR